MELITNKQVKEFLKDWEINSEIEFLEEGKEKNDILSIAKTKGYELKNNTDLAGFKCTYAFANKANKNNARLPKKPLLKALPSMIGKPINIDHQRRYVVGHYIDYSYNQKQDKVIGYGVIYKSNFDEEWEDFKTLFKKKKLTTSYEIWCPKNKRRNLADGTYELLQQEIAGGAILLTEEPAFKDAKVLQLAMKRMEKAKDLVYASIHKKDELIIADDNTKTVTVPVLQKLKIKCSNCNSEFESLEASEIKCPSCLAIVNKEGNMIYPPQKKDFQIICPSCKSSHWKILARDKEGATLKCLNESMCGKTYKITWAKEKAKSKVPGLSYLYIGKIACYQCGKINEVLGTSKSITKEVKCNRCGLVFSYDIKSEKTYMKIEKIVGIDISKNSEKGGNTMKDVIKDGKTSEEKPEVKEEPKVEVNIEKSEAIKEEKPETVVKEEIVEEIVKPEEKAPKAEEKIEVSTVEKYPKTKTLRKAIKKIKDLENSITTAKLETEGILKNGIKKVAKQLIEAKKQVKLYAENAKEILTRRAEIGSYEISDEDILNEDKFEKAKLELENAKLKAEKENANDIIGIKPEKGKDYYTNIQKKINKDAFGYKD